jgi:L-ascorbate metabolism protein UlaG (beta-lactamase superfamily)
MRITFHGHAAAQLDVEGATILIDPFITGNSLAEKAGISAASLTADVILLTHAHGDHFGDTPAIAKRTGALVVAQHEIAEYMGRVHGHSNVHGINIGGSWSFDWGRVTQTYARHSSSFPDGTYGGLASGYIVQAGGRTVYHAGDTSAFAEMAWIGEEHSLDLALLPIGDNYTMGSREAVRCLKMLRPAVTVPIHYNTFPPIAADPAEFVRLAAEAGFTVRPLAAGESIDLG